MRNGMQLNTWSRRLYQGAVYVRRNNYVMFISRIRGNEVVTTTTAFWLPVVAKSGQGLFDE